MTLSVELNKTDLEISTKLIFNTDSILDVHFGQKKTLFEIGWCSTYMIDKRKIASAWLNFLG